MRANVGPLGQRAVAHSRMIAAADVSALPTGSILWADHANEFWVVVPGGVAPISLLAERAGRPPPDGEPADWMAKEFALVSEGKGRVPTHGTAERHVIAWIQKGQRVATNPGTSRTEFGEAAAKQWMRDNLTEFVDRRTNEVNLTRLAEETAIAEGHTEWLDDSNHPVWDWAVEVTEAAGYAHNPAHLTLDGKFSSGLGKQEAAHLALDGTFSFGVGSKDDRAMQSNAYDYERGPGNYGLTDSEIDRAAARIAGSDDLFGRWSGAVEGERMATAAAIVADACGAPVQNIDAAALAEVAREIARIRSGGMRNNARRRRAPAPAGGSVVVSSVLYRGIWAVPVRLEIRAEPGTADVRFSYEEKRARETRVRLISALVQLDSPLEMAITVHLDQSAVAGAAGYSGLDLPIALGVLALQGRVPRESLLGTMAVGELALDGSLRPVRGAAVAAVGANVDDDTEVLLVPAENEVEARFLAKTPVMSFGNVSEVVSYMQTRDIPREPPIAFEPCKAGSYEAQDPGLPPEAVQAAQRGQNLLLIGPPGAGKMMAARYIHSTLPPLSVAEAKELTEIYSVAGLLQNNYACARPFRAPHHSVSQAGLIGGGDTPRPGEVTLATMGVLLLDELTEFRGDSLRSLSDSIHSGRAVHRVRGGADDVWFPAHPLVVIGTANPCPCGHLGTSRCRCTTLAIASHEERLREYQAFFAMLRVDLRALTVAEMAGGSMRRNARYWSVVIPWSKTPTRWHPTERTGSFATLTRGAFRSEAEAHRWADENLGGQPYSLREYDDEAIVRNAKGDIIWQDNLLTWKSVGENRSGEPRGIDMIPTGEGRLQAQDMLEERQSPHFRRSPLSQEIDFLEAALGNGWSTVPPEDIGALTEATIVSQDGFVGDDGKWYPHPEVEAPIVYAHMNYAVEDPVEMWAEGKPVFWMADVLTVNAEQRTRAREELSSAMGEAYESNARKNVTAVINAFLAGRRHSEKTCSTDGWRLYSYALLIAARVDAKGEPVDVGAPGARVVVLDKSLSPSATTSTQINAVLSAVPGAQVVDDMPYASRYLPNAGQKPNARKGQFKAPASLSPAEKFFFEWAGGSYTAGASTAQRKRERIDQAKAMAAAEAEGEDRGWKVEWDYDQDPDISWMDEEQREELERGATEMLVAMLRDENGNVLGSLGGVHVSARGGRDPYGRVVEAELIQEALEAERSSGTAMALNRGQRRQARNPVFRHMDLGDIEQILGPQEIARVMSVDRPEAHAKSRAAGWWDANEPDYHDAYTNLARMLKAGVLDDLVAEARGRR